MVSWEGVTAVTGLLTLTGGGLIGFGKLRQRIEDMKQLIVIHSAQIADHEKALSDSTANLKVIDVKLDNLLLYQSDMKTQISKMDDRLRQHCEMKDA